MVLIIPTITIAHGVCGTQIATLAHETHPSGRDIYGQDPIDRARLLRTENAKTIHLHFVDRDPWSEPCLSLISKMREAVDIPLGVSLRVLPENKRDFDQLFAAGIYRVFLPPNLPESIIFQYCTSLTCRHIIPTIDLKSDYRRVLAGFKAQKIERVAIDMSSRDSLELGTIDWERLSDVSKIAASLCIRLTGLRGIRGYPELRQFQDLSPALDSLVLCRALNENRFPCQVMWREMEAESAISDTPGSNLWKNPLEGRPHV